MIRYVSLHLFRTRDNCQQAALAAVAWKNKRPFAVIAEEIAEPIGAKSGNVPLGSVAEENRIFQKLGRCPSESLNFRLMSTISG